MAGERISADEVRARLRVLTSADISDTQLAITAYIPMSEAWLNLLLTKRSKSYDDDFTTDEKVMLKTAQILQCCIAVINSAPEEQYENSIQKFKGTPEEWKHSSIKQMRSEQIEALRLAGIKMKRTGGGFTGGNDYTQTGPSATSYTKLWRQIDS